MTLRQMCPVTYNSLRSRYTSLSPEEVEQRVYALFLEEVNASIESAEFRKAESRDVKWRIEIFTAKLEAIAKRDRLEEEKAVEFRSLTADLFVDVLSQYERINGRSHPRASNPADLSILRLIDLVPNLDQKHFLAIIPPSIGKDYWLEPFSEIVQYRNQPAFQSKERLASLLSLPPYRYSLDFFILVPLFEYAYEASIEEVIQEEAKRMRDIVQDTVQDEGESLSKCEIFRDFFSEYPQGEEDLQWMRMPE